MRATCTPGEPISVHLSRIFLSLAPHEQQRLCQHLEDSVRFVLQQKRGTISTNGLPALSKARARSSAAPVPRLWLESECPSIYAEVRTVVKEIRRRADTGQKPRPPAPPLILAAAPAHQPQALQPEPPPFLEGLGTSDRITLEATMERMVHYSAPQRRALMEDALEQAYIARLSQLTAAERRRAALLAHLATPPEARSPPWRAVQSERSERADVSTWHKAVQVQALEAAELAHAYAKGTSPMRGVGIRHASVIGMKGRRIAT